MSTIEGYAKAKLLWQLSKDFTVFDWVGLDFISSKHRLILQDTMLKLSDENFEITRLKIKKRRKKMMFFVPI